MDCVDEGSCRERWRAGHRRIFAGLEEVIGEDLEEMQQLYERMTYGRLEREQSRKLKGNVDFKNGVEYCFCDDCTAKRQRMANLHKELEGQARSRGETGFKRGLPDCPCERCKELQVFEAEQDELKQKQCELGKMDFKGGVTGCRCAECWSTLRDTKPSSRFKKGSTRTQNARHFWRGKTDFSSGVSGCRYCKGSVRG